MDPESRGYTAFATPDGGAYQFKVMPFRLNNAPSSFQRLMTQEVLVGHLRRFCLVYPDDIIVYSEDWNKHQVLERLAQHGLVCFLPKCCFGVQELSYLGHRI